MSIFEGRSFASEGRVLHLYDCAEFKPQTKTRQVHSQGYSSLKAASGAS